MNKQVFIFEQASNQNMVSTFSDPTEFKFSYQKHLNQQKDYLSPVETCLGTPDNQALKQANFYNKEQKQFKSSFSNNMELVIVNECIDKYDTSLSKYLSQCFKVIADDKLDFLSLPQFEQLAVQNKQLQKIVQQYQVFIEKRESVLKKMIQNHQKLKWFLEEITYINKEKINFELLIIVDEILLNYNQKQIKFCLNKTQKLIEELLQNEQINFINLRFLKNSMRISIQQAKELFFKFIGALSEIVECLVEQKQSKRKVKEEKEIGICLQKIKGLNLYSSKNDLWDSEQESESQLGKSKKKVKLN